MTVSFEVMETERRLIGRIVNRFNTISIECKRPPVDKAKLVLDITAFHVNDARLSLYALLHAPRPEFVSDVAGITNTIDRSTGKLTGSWRPTFEVK